MITREDIVDAIEKCQGQKNPTATTCIKLAAYYIILDHLFESDYSYKSRPSSEFLDVIKIKSEEGVMLVIDELMDEIRETNPKLYYATIAKLDNL